MIELSIIIPCYNSFKLMNQCLKSLEEQNTHKIEVVIIDDCSIDNTYEKLKEYKEKSELKITLFKNIKNKGPGLSRNKGIELSKGKYITFLDSDDYLKEDAIVKLLDLLIGENIDCLLFDYYFKKKNNLIRGKTLLSGERGFVDKRKALIYSTGSTCCKIYKKNLIVNNKVRFPNLMRNEDMPFNKIAISVCEKIFYENKEYYYYVQQVSSLMHNNKLRIQENDLFAFKILKKRLGKKYPYEIEAIFAKEVLYSIVTIMILDRYKNKEVINRIKELEKICPNWNSNLDVKKISLFLKICLVLINKKWINILKILVIIKTIIKKIIL